MSYPAERSLETICAPIIPINRREESWQSSRLFDLLLPVIGESLLSLSRRCRNKTRKNFEIHKTSPPASISSLCSTADASSWKLMTKLFIFSSRSRKTNFVADIKKAKNQPWNESEKIENFTNFLHCFCLTPLTQSARLKIPQISLDILTLLLFSCWSSSKSFVEKELEKFSLGRWAGRGQREGAEKLFTFIHFHLNSLNSS